MSTLKALWPVVNQFQNKNGSILTSGRIYVYYKNRTALAEIFSDEDGKVVNSNPVLLDNNGRATVFADTAYSYTIVVCDYYGKELFSQDITLHDAISTAEDVIVMGSNGSVKIDTTTLPNGVQYDMSVNTNIIATKESVDDVKTDLNTLTGTVNNHTTQIGQIQEGIVGIESTVANKKDKQNELNFNGSATKTVKKITQNPNGELNVEFENIDLPQEVPNVEISSEDNSVQITETTDTQTNTKKFDLSVNVDDKIPDPSTSNPLMDGTASVGSSSKYAREDHIHPTDTSREAIDNKTTVVLGTSNSKYPTDKAVADFVNSSVATNTANYISNNGEPFTSVEELEAYTGTVTNNDYAFVTGTDSAGNTYYDRYKATVSGETVTWALEYRLNNSSFTAAQWSAINSGITSALVAKIHDHSNKDVLDGITSSDVANWNSKQNSLTAGNNIIIDGDTISSNQVFVASDGITKYAEVKAAYDAGKICMASSRNNYYYLTQINSEFIWFVASNPSPNISALKLTRNNKWEFYSQLLQKKMTFDDEPTAGSTNPVTSDGIKTAIDAKATKVKSVYLYDAFMRRMGENTGWRRLAYKQFNSTNSNVNALFRLYVFGSDNNYVGLGDLLVNIRFGTSGSAPVFNTCYLINYKPLNTSVKVKVIGVAGKAVVELWFKPIKYSMLTLSCLGNGRDVISLTKDWTFREYLDATDPEPVEDVANNIYVFSGTERRIQTSIANPTNGNLVIMDANGLVEDSGKATSDFATKAALDSRVPAPTSTTGTQVLKCINGVIQWVTE